MLDLVMGVLLISALGLASWNLKMTVDLSGRITAIESNRFTSKDALEVWQEIGSIRKDIAGLPPDYFESQFDDLVGVVHDISERLARIEERTRP
jgi:hypothetical protein